MLRKLAPWMLSLGLLAAACGRPDVVVGPAGEGEVQFFPMVLDADGDVGAGLSMTTDGQGNPHVSYLAFEEEPAPGEPPPVPDPEAPELPAVLHSHIVEDQRSLSPVAEGTGVAPEDETAIAVDGDGVHHVVWTESGSLRYANNAGGDFSDPEEIIAGDVTGPSIAVDGDGTPWVAFAASTGAEGPGGLVRVATPGDGGWTVETAAEVGEAGGTAIAAAGPRILVAYGSEGETRLATGPDTWESETADPDGGAGVAMAVDGEGNPHLAYLASGGQVKHAHSIDGGPWEVSEVGQGADPEAGGASIALDAEGVHHVAWAAEGAIQYANNAEGDFAAEEVPASQSGARPAVGPGPEGSILVGWFDTEGTEVQLAIRADDPPLLVLPEAPEAGPTDGDTTPAPPDQGPPPCEPDGTELEIAAPPGASVDGFDKDCLAAPAGEAFTIDFDNQDEGVPHNVAIYVSQGGEEIFVGDIFPGPDQVTYDVDPIDQTGNLFFQCDVHPQTMTGTFVVQ